MSVIRFLKARLEERSTWAAIGAAVVAGATLPSPYSWLAIAAGVAGALIPTKKGDCA